jgi:integrase
VQHHEGISQKTLATRERLGSATVYRWYQEFLDLKLRERQNDPCPRVLGIDEHFFSRKDGFATTFCDLGKRKIFDVTLGRSEKALEPYLNRLVGKEQVKVVCMDLSTTYRSIVQQRWLQLRETGVGKHDLKVQGLREHGDMYHETRRIIFTGNTRVTYERVLKGFVGFSHDRGIERNADISKREMRVYMEHLMDRGRSESYLDKIRSACVKFGALHGKYESFHAMSEKMGEKIRDLVEDGVIAGPVHQRITPEVADRAIERLAELDAQFEGSRAYHLAAELQRECGLRAIEATERLTPDRLVEGYVIALEKGGKELARPVPADLYRELKDYFAESGASCLASERAYQSAFGRAVLEVGGRSTGTHSLRRLWADEYRGERYREHLAEGMPPEQASEAAMADTMEALGHWRDRNDLRQSYLRSA